jgi:hypothetical protein
MNAKTISPQRHRVHRGEVVVGTAKAAAPSHDEPQKSIYACFRFSLCLCVSGETTDETTSHLTNPAKYAGQVIGYSHSTKAGKSASQVAGYVVEILP